MDRRHGDGLLMMATILKRMVGLVETLPLVIASPICVRMNLSFQMTGKASSASAKTLVVILSDTSLPTSGTALRLTLIGRYEWRSPVGQNS
jgi:hypothetical protein